MKSTAPGIVSAPTGSAAMPRFTGIIIAFWAGSLWSICGLIAPSLFALLEDRAVAGRLAGHFFDMATLIGIAAAGVLLALTLTGRYVLGRRGRVLVLLTAGLPVLSKLGLSPLMEQARSAGDMARFGMLHGVAAVLFMLACIAAVAMVWNLLRPESEYLSPSRDDS
jgi:hypothetical protein